ncbi:MAG: DndE family protein [Clostridia bacterium]|nr:DndE family protein [Clostridia bacterium]
MVFKIRTSKKTMELFEEITASTNLAPYILSKLAISMSLKVNTPLTDADFKTDSFGLELNRQTITGEHDALFKSLIEVFEGIHLNDDDFFQKYIKAHLDRGARLIYSEYKYNSDFLLALISEENTI